MVLKGDTSVRMTLPVNSTWMDIDGYVGPRYGRVQVDIHPPPPGGMRTWYLDTNRPWYARDGFVKIGLNPIVLYDVTLSTKAGTVGDGVYLNSTRIIPYDSYA